MTKYYVEFFGAQRMPESHHCHKSLFVEAESLIQAHEKIHADYDVSRLSIREAWSNNHETI